MGSKRGVSAIIATVLIIMISVAAVAILWQFIIPSIKDNLKESTSEKAQISIETTGGYTTWDEVQKIARVQVKRGSDNVNLTGLDFSFIREGSSVNKNRTDVPGKNEVKVYEFQLSELTGKPEKVTVAPITSSGKGNVVSESNVIQNYSEGGSSASSFPNLLVTISLIPSVLLVSDAIEEGINGTYNYHHSSNYPGDYWYNGGESYIYRELYYGVSPQWWLFKASSGTPYVAEDNQLSFPPSNFSKNLSLPLEVTVSSTQYSDLNGIYLKGKDIGSYPSWYKSGQQEPFNQGVRISRNQWFWWIESNTSSPNKWFTAFVSDDYLLGYNLPPPKNGWIDTGAAPPVPILEYTLPQINVTVVPVANLLEKTLVYFSSTKMWTSESYFLFKEGDMWVLRNNSEIISSVSYNGEDLPPLSGWSNNLSVFSP